MTPKVFLDPAKLETYSKRQLVEIHEQGKAAIEELDNQCKAIRDYLTELIKGNGEVIGEYTVTKMRRKNYTVDLAKAEELGAIKIQKSLDSNVLRALEKKGVEIPHTITEYLMIKMIVKEIVK